MIRQAIFAAVLATASTPAFAWGEREQGILTGIAASVLWNKVQEAEAREQYNLQRDRGPVIVHRQYVRPAAVYQPAPVYAPAPVYQPAPVQIRPDCRQIPVRDEHDLIVEFRLICGK